VPVHPGGREASPTRFRSGGRTATRLSRSTGPRQELPLCRLRYGDSANIWGFSLYRASHNDYQPSPLHTGMTAGSPEDALDTACGLYLNNPSAWTADPRRTNEDKH